MRRFDLLTPYLARSNPSTAFAQAEAAAKAVLVKTIKTKHNAHGVVQACRTAPYAMAFDA